MDLDEQYQLTKPTLLGQGAPNGGAKRPAEPQDYDSLNSAPTVVGQGVAGASLGQIDQYQLVRKLGGGGFGVVYLACDTVSGVDVALKTLHPLLKSNPEEMESLRAKFALVSRLSHPNIASPLVLHPCRDIAITDDATRREMRLSPGDFIMVMRYAPGVTLSKWRRQFPDGVVPLDLALEVVRQVASALDYAHSEKIIHRDIKPANIMVETLDGCGESHTEAQRHRDGGARLRIRILDFGLAAEIRSSMSRISTETGDTSGTRPYMAPEQWLGRKQDGRTDQYALACVAYEMLSGAPPFAGAFETGDLGIMERAVTARTPEEIEDVPAHVNAALLKALAKNPKERFANCTEFVGNCLAQSSQSLQRNFIAEAQRGGESVSGAFNLKSRIPNPASKSAISEAEVLRRKVALERAVKAIPVEDRADKELKVLVDELEELVVLDQACRYSRFAAAAESLDRADATLANIGNVKAARAEAERKAREEAERKTREEAVRKAKEEAERSAREEDEKARLAKAEAGTVAGVRKVIRVGSKEVALRWCPPGSFTMGSPATEEGRYNDETQHRVTLMKGFWMGETEVTQGLWEEVLGNNPANFKSGDDYPVERVSWDDCQEFMKKLNARFPQSGLRWDLPTEAQWEYACRAGTTGSYSGSGRLDDIGWYDGNSGSKTHPVKQKPPNAWGLYDMHGNVWEWCQDRYGNYPSGPVTDPTGVASGGFRVLRGGSYWRSPRRCRSANRGGSFPGYRGRNYGFRVALVPVQ